ncbi:MAG TPA: glycoside hydrolase family 38 C-terminal domain-containing protein, partial [Cyanobium sp.]|nr:glycoside hydrolase family 38 C-terminal domain-containing protein [Cyanobium sp.]
LYLELHRGCATSRPDEKRHNRSLERLLREADLAAALCGEVGGEVGEGGSRTEALDWRTLLFHQFHDILPGTSIPEVFEQAEPEWRSARRRARQRRDRRLGGCSVRCDQGGPGTETQAWRVLQLQPLPPAPRTVRLPAGRWSLPADGGTSPARGTALAGQPAPGGGQWIQLPGIAGVGVLPLRRTPPDPPGSPDPPDSPRAIDHPVHMEPAGDPRGGRWRLGNGLLTTAIGPLGVEQLWDGGGVPQLAAPLAWGRWQDRGEFWDAWDLAPRYRERPLPWSWQGEPQWIEQGPLCARFLWRGTCGSSAVRLDGRLLAGTPWLELVLSVQWRQRHELLRLEIPLARPAWRWAADTSGGVIERPAAALTPRERQRWEVPAISWLASENGAGGVAVLLDGPQGVSAEAERLGVSLLRGPTWPDPGADNGFQRQRLALMACPGGWRAAAVPRLARRLREPLWCHPALQGEVPAGWTPLPPLGDDLALVGLRPAADGGGDVILSVQNEGPCRRRLDPGPHWRLVERLDGLDGRVGGAGLDGLGPWQLG